MSRLSELLLGGSWVVISRVTVAITYTRGILAPFITAHEPPSRLQDLAFMQGLGCIPTLETSTFSFGSPGALLPSLGLRV